MKRSRFSEEQIIGMLKEAEATTVKGTWSYRRLAHQDSKQTPGLVGDFKILFSFAASRIFRSMTTILTYSDKLTHSPA